MSPDHFFIFPSVSFHVCCNLHKQTDHRTSACALEELYAVFTVTKDAAPVRAGKGRKASAPHTCISAQDFKVNFPRLLDAGRSRTSVSTCAVQ